MIRFPRRKSLNNFLFVFGLIWFLLLTLFLSWNNDSREFGDVKEKNIVKSQLKAEEDQPSFDDFEDDFADLPKKKTAKKVFTKKPTKVMKSEEKKFVKSPKVSSNLDPPKLSKEVLELHTRLNLSNPGHMGQPVILPSNLPFDIQEKINKSWEIYSINEFVSNLIPLYRELPDIRPDYCRSVQYSTNLPVTSVIMVFINEVSKIDKLCQKI